MLQKKLEHLKQNRKADEMSAKTQAEENFEEKKEEENVNEPMEENHGETLDKKTSAKSQKKEEQVGVETLEEVARELNRNVRLKANVVDAKDQFDQNIPYKFIASLAGHLKGVTSLAIDTVEIVKKMRTYFRQYRLMSSSEDFKIRVWNYFKKKNRTVCKL